MKKTILFIGMVVIYFHSFIALALESDDVKLDEVNALLNCRDTISNIVVTPSVRIKNIVKPNQDEIFFEIVSSYIDGTESKLATLKVDKTTKIEKCPSNVENCKEESFEYKCKYIEP